ncbi:MAG: TonB-dependent receptor [Pseudomonas veronii]|nr:TonB-dependent receptor [Pseudomonas veronii]
MKGEFFNGGLNTSLAYFEVHETNRAEADALYNANPTNSAISYAYKGITAKTKGFEAELSGEPAPGWQAQAGYTHKNHPRREWRQGLDLGTPGPSQPLYLLQTQRGSGPPDHRRRWHAGRARPWQDVYNSGKSRYEEFSQEAYWVVDAMAKYQITDNVSATLNVNNLFDKYYYTNIGFYNTAYYGDPRNVMVTTRWDF